MNITNAAIKREIVSYVIANHCCSSKFLAGRISISDSRHIVMKVLEDCDADVRRYKRRMVQFLSRYGANGWDFDTKLLGLVMRDFLDVYLSPEEIEDMRKNLGRTRGKYNSESSSATAPLTDSAMQALVGQPS